MDLDLYELIELVQQMRAAQRLYLREWTPRTWAAARSLEREVDRVIEHEAGPRAELKEELLGLFNRVEVHTK